MFGWWWIRAAVLLVPLWMAGSGCAPDSRARPNVLLITIDTLRPDRLGAYGADRVRTPNIDRLAAQGVLFENAVTDTPWTTPSMSSVMTGNYATVHGFKSTNVDRLGPENETLAEILRDAGYTTAAIVGSFPLDSVFQLDQGFDRYDDHFTTSIWTMPGHEFERIESAFFESPDDQRFFILSKALNDSRREDSEVSDAALAWLAEDPAEPFFLWVHYFGPHEKPDWRVAEERREGRRIAMYAPDTEEMDRQVGRLVEAIDDRGLAANTLVVFHADHGESLGEQGLVGHGQLLNAATMNVPLILRYPGRLASGHRDQGLARNVDIFPTVLDAAGLEVAHESPGESLLPRAGSFLTRGWETLRAARRSEPVAYMETYYPAHVAFATPVTLADGTASKVGLIRRGVQTREWKFVRTDPHPLVDVAAGSTPAVPDELAAMVVREELFHLTESGDERDVLQRHPEVAAQMRELLQQHLETERSRTPEPPLEVDPEMKLRLESLGYGE
jgi:arylsulfatase A-like enzyme